MVAGGDMPADLGALFQYVRTRLHEAGIADAGREARQLIIALSDVTAEQFLSHPERCLDSECRERILQAAGKRIAGMPIGRIAGRRSFYGRDFLLGEAILEPRADSEVLIDAVLEIVRNEGLLAGPLRLIDIGTGSGCLLITLLAELPNATGLGVDLSAEALEVAARNAGRLGVESRARFKQHNALEGVEGEYDILISNPPYIRTDELAGLDVEVREHDPRLALDGGIDGLDIYRRIGAEVRRVVPDGWMLFEVGAGMACDVCHEIDQFAGDDQKRRWRKWRDMGGHIRCVAAKTLTSRCL